MSEAIGLPSGLGLRWMLKKLLISSVASFQTLVLSASALEMLETVPMVMPFFNMIVSCVGLLNRIVLTSAPKYPFGMPSLLEEQLYSWPGDISFDRWIALVCC